MADHLALCIGAVSVAIGALATSLVAIVRTIKAR